MPRAYLYFFGIIDLIVAVIIGYNIKSLECGLQSVKRRSRSISRTYHDFDFILPKFDLFSSMSEPHIHLDVDTAGEERIIDVNILYIACKFACRETKYLGSPCTRR